MIVCVKKILGSNSISNSKKTRVVHTTRASPVSRHTTRASLGVERVARLQLVRYPAKSGGPEKPKIRIRISTKYSAKRE